MADSARDAEVVRLRATGLSYRQIAAQVGTSLGGVQRALRRAENREAEEALHRLRVDRRALETTLQTHPRKETS